MNARPLSALLALLALAAFAALPSVAVAASPRPSGLATPAAEADLIAVLEKPESSVAQKALACQQLAIVGGPRVVPAVVPLLNHPQLAAQARNVLQNLPGPEAGAALREALTRLEGPFLIGVVNSLGIRRDPEAVDALLAIEKNPLHRFWPEVYLALGRIASPAALQALRRAAGGPFDRELALVEAYVLAGEALIADGRRPQAVEFYDLARTQRITPTTPLRLAALRGAILARGDEGIPLLTEQFRSQDRVLRELAARVARELPGPAVSHALAAQLGNSDPSVQSLILGALGDRPQTGLSRAVEPLAASPDPEVRLAALRALGSLGNASSLPVLLRPLSVADGADTSEADAATESLTRLTDPDADAVLLRELAAAPAPARARIARILGYRRARGATEPLLARAEETDAVVAKAAFDALAAVASLDELPKVIPVATSRTEGEVRDRAEKALYAICLKQNDVSRRSEPLARALPGTPTPTARASLLQVMAMLADPAGARALGEACGDPVPETRDTALRLLVNWPDSTPVPTLLRVFKTTTNDVHRILALKGIVTLASLRPGDPTASASTSAPKPPSAEAVAWLTEARAALRPNAEERKILVSGLGDLNAAPGLRLLEPYLADPEVHHDAELAALRAIRNLTTDADRAAARPLLEKIMASTLDPDVRKQAQDALRGSSPKP